MLKRNNKVHSPEIQLEVQRGMCQNSRTVFPPQNSTYKNRRQFQVLLLNDDSIGISRQLQRNLALQQYSGQKRIMRHHTVQFFTNFIRYHYDIARLIKRKYRIA